jgi:hypothetical protein
MAIEKVTGQFGRGNELQRFQGIVIRDQREADLAKLILICREVANFADSIQSDQNSLWNCEALRPGNGRTSYNEFWIQSLPAQDRIITSRPDIAYGVPRLSRFLILIPNTAMQRTGHCYTWSSILQDFNSAYLVCRQYDWSIVQKRPSNLRNDNAIQWSNRMTEQPKRRSLRCCKLLIKRLIRQWTVDPGDHRSWIKVASVKCGI